MRKIVELIPSKNGFNYKVQDNENKIYYTSEVTRQELITFMNESEDPIQKSYAEEIVEHIYIYTKEYYG